MKQFSMLMVLIFVLASCTKAVEEKTLSQDSSVAMETQEVEVEKVAMSAKGYEKYTPEAIANAKGKIVLFFHAEWCATCKRIQKDIFANTIPDDVTIIEVNYDEELELKKKYGVNKTSTLVEVDNQGNKVKLFKASTLAEIVESVSGADVKDAVVEEKSDDKESTQGADTMMKGEDSALPAKGYEKYTPEAIANAKGKIVLFFHAEWCATCKRIQKDIFANTIPDDVTIIEANYDEELELRKKYGVNKTSTLVEVDNQGNKIQLFKADTLSEIVEKVEDSSNTAEESKETMMKNDDTKTESVTTAGSYIEYSESAFAAASGKKVLFFAASWCPSCVAADKNLEAETVAEGLSVFKVDYDSNTDLREKYGVTSQHTFVLVDDNMEKVKLMVGGKNSQDIVEGLLK